MDPCGDCSVSGKQIEAVGTGRVQQIGMLGATHRQSNMAPLVLTLAQL